MSISSSTVGGSRTKYKIIFLGDQSVGKSSIIEKYIKDKFEQGLNPTVGIDFHIKNVSRNGMQYRVQLWDTAGQERFRSLIPNYMKDANCAVMVYDVSKRITLNNIKIWNDMFEEHQMPDAIKLLVGNKIDLSQRQITKKQGQLQASKYNCQHFQVSARMGKKLDDLFNGIIDSIADNLQNRGKLPPVQQQQKHQNNHNINNKPQQHQGQQKFQLKPIPVPQIKKQKKCC